jgi:hypothetical protein
MNASAESTYHSWHAPFLALLAQHENVKAFSYIDQDWEAVPRWKGWGDSRIEVASELLQASWKGALSGGMVVNRAQRSELLSILGVPPGVFTQD